MSEESHKESLAVTVGEFSFRVRVEPDQVDRFERIARAANATLEQVQSGAGALSGPRAMAMALFQLSVELDEMRRHSEVLREQGKRIDSLIEKIDRAVARGL